MFVDRENELKALEDLYKSGKAVFMPIYGRRRVGKSELILRFMAGKKGVYLLGKTIAEKAMLETFSTRISSVFSDNVLEKNPLRSWEALFAYLCQKAEKENIVVAMDEFPYLVKTNDALPSILQAEWDEHIKDSKMFLILCGSSIGMMEKEVLEYKSPLYGRRTGQILLHPLRFRHIRPFLPGYSEKSLMEAYAILGGVPAYLLEFDKSRSIAQNIENNILARDSYLYDEVPFLLREELREPANYFAILKELSFGKTALNDLVNSTGLERGMVSSYLDSLIALKIVERRVPVTEKNPHKSRRGIYRIADCFFRFWFRFVFPNKDLLVMDKQREVMKNSISPYLDSFVAFAFEDVCREILWEVNDGRSLPFMFERIGAWWGGGNEIDIVALSETSREILFAECKWTSKPVDIGIVKGLLEKSRLVEWNREKRKEHFALFSKSGFTEGCKAYCRENAILTFDLPDIEKMFK